MRYIFKLLLLMVIAIPSLTLAKEEYFINENGVSLTEKEYNYLIMRFDKIYVKQMDLNDYNYMIKDELLDKEIKINYLESTMPLSVLHETPNKSLKISSVCSSTMCSISVVAKWKTNPTVRSYDVIGAYFTGTNMLNSTVPQTRLSSSTENFTSLEIKKQNFGFGVTVKLPTNGTDITIYQSYYVEPGGIINASYQHAKSKTTLESSKNYTISNEGYGGVFLFNSAIRNKYDAMGGVKISV